MLEDADESRYDAKVENLPFLFEAAANSAIADRARIIDLIVDIGAPVDEDEYDDCDADELASYQEANALVRGRAEEFVALLADHDAAVRRAAVFAVAGFLGDGERVLALFRERMEVETDTACRIALVEITTRLAERVEQLASWLEQIAGGVGVADPATRLAALVQLARIAPDRPRDGLVDQGIAFLRGMPDARAVELLEGLSDVLEERVADRVALIEDQLGYADPRRHTEALRLAGQLMRGWRGSYANLVALIGGQLASPEPRVARMALLALKDKYELVVPAADALAERVSAAGPDAWNSADRDVRNGYRDMLVSLARIGDERVVPVVAEKLTVEAGAFTLGHALAKYRDHADRFVPTLRAQLNAYADELASGRFLGTFGLLIAVRDLGAVEALPEVRRLIDAAIEAEQWMVVEVALRVFEFFGPAAAEAYDVALGLTASDAKNGEIALRAIAACWSMRGDAAVVLPLLAHQLEAAASNGEGASAAKVARDIGPQAAPLAGHLRTLMAASTSLWTQVECSIALTRVLGPEAYPSVRAVLEAAWQENPHTRVPIAECVRDLGAAAESFHPLLRAELASPRRHTFTSLATDSSEVYQDERLLELCTQALAL